MSVREEERQKNNCPSRGLGLAAAAIGVGVGAALYYFFSKRPENPDGEGSTSEGWSCEQPQTLNDSHNSYTTISEHSTTDTSINESDCRCNYCYETMDSEESDSESGSLTETSTDDDSATDVSDDLDSFDSDLSNISNLSHVDGTIDLTELDQVPIEQVNSDSDMAMEWDVTNSSLGVPQDDNSYLSTPVHRLFGRIMGLMSPVNPARNDRITSEEEQIRILRDQAFRERSWSLEECSICFEVMLKDQELMTLPCTHNFHVQCIGPWLQEQQTCPNCRKAAE